MDVTLLSGGDRLCVALNPLSALPTKVCSPLHRNVLVLSFTLQMRVAHASYTCVLPDGTCVPGMPQHHALQRGQAADMSSDLIGVMRAALAAGGEGVAAATVSVGVRCAQ